MPRPMKALITYFGGVLRAVLCSVFALVVFMGCSEAVAGKLVIKIQVANKSSEKEVVQVRSNLPKRITPADIIDLAGLNLGYDVKSDTYYVDDSVELEPGEIRVFNVVTKDIWQLNSSDVERYRTRAKKLAGQLAGTDSSAKASEDLEKIEAETEGILKRQQASKITLVPPVEHIQAYEKNIKVLQDIKRRVGNLENLALAAGVDPGQALIGDDVMASSPRRSATTPLKYGEAVMKVTVHNPSATRSVKTNIRTDLPAELSVDDVVDAGGLGVRYDSQKKVAYVYKNDVELQPNETLTYKVRIHDKWNINGERMKFLQKQVNDLLRQCQGKKGIDAVVNTLNDAAKDLTATMKASGPKELNPGYIAYYRRQSDKLDNIEKTLNRVEAALRPLDTHRGFELPAPDRKTTWLVIWIILGFLALMSMLFFLRWFVKSS